MNQKMEKSRSHLWWILLSPIMHDVCYSAVALPHLVRSLMAILMPIFLALVVGIVIVLVSNIVSGKKPSPDPARSKRRIVGIILYVLMGLMLVGYAAAAYLRKDLAFAMAGLVKILVVNLVSLATIVLVVYVVFVLFGLAEKRQKDKTTQPF